MQVSLVLLLKEVYVLKNIWQILIENGFLRTRKQGVF